MAQWYVKEISKLTQVTVQTLHHYDRIGLLKPSVRLPNGYRLYSEKDLLKLQQIIALKFFNFELAQIKILLSTNIDMVDHLNVQSQFLEEKAKTLLEASLTLKNIIWDCSRDKSIPWETIIQSIGVYRMTQQLEKTWAGKVLTPAELKEYASFEQELNNRFTEKERKVFEQTWIEIVDEVNANLDKDPNGEIGKAIGKRCMEWVNAYYGKKHVALRNAIWEKGLKQGRVDAEKDLSATGSNWLDRAISAYYREQIMNILNQVGTLPDDVLHQQWEALLNDIHGDEQDPKNEIYTKIMTNDKISPTAKKWVKEYFSRQ